MTEMDPQAFVRLSIGSLGIKIPTYKTKNVKVSNHLRSSPITCEFRLRGFPIQTASVPLVPSSQARPESQSCSTVFYLEDTNLNALVSSGCFQSTQAYLDIVVFNGLRKSQCGVARGRRQIGAVRVRVGTEGGEGKPVVLHNGWVSVRKLKKVGNSEPELHLRVKLDPDFQYVFQFEDETTLSPQVVQLQRGVKQPIFSCEFSREKRASQLDGTGNIWLLTNPQEPDAERKERKGWKAIIHDLSGSAVAAAFMVTPFVPSSGCDFVQRSNPGAWLIARADPLGALESWHPWARLESWRESGPRDSVVCLRLHLLAGGQDAGLLMSEVSISAKKGGEFFIDRERNTPTGSPLHSSFGSLGEFDSCDSAYGGFVMNCRVEGEGKSSKPLVKLSTRHVSCVEDAALFIALAAAVDLSVEACKPFGRKTKKRTIRSPGLLRVDS